ncbi:GerW family sporulation protein [Haladaptatus sp. CMSO5]|uniref:GerW family sporulation protein n=1 Tax=Haladaptatus sp. CMSO5 TaxID=3120514 RepID=UPI002FCE1D8A
MDAQPIQTLVEQLRSSASVTAVYGDPVEHADKTVIPVARIAYGFGGGYGQSDSATGAIDSDIRAGDDEASIDSEGRTDGATSTETTASEADGEGAGFGGGVAAMPIGVVEITDTDTRFIRFSDRKHTARTILLGIAIGLLLSRTLRRRD